jgi:glycosyltransferase involved in cell wall biosynthesis
MKRLSVVVVNHNYERYVGAAIESALAVEWDDVEVVVVDDGSTDESHEVLRAYGSSVVTVFKEQGGQVSALNAAFERSRGELVCLLDADDAFAPTKIERVVEARRRHPGALLIHHQAQIIDAAGRPRHGPFPRHVPHGDIRAAVLRSGGWFPHAPSGALSFARPYVERLFPVPPERQPVPTRAGVRRLPFEVDTYLAGPAALLAPVAGIEEPLTFRRTHDANRIATSEPSPEHTAEKLARYQLETAVMADVLRERFGHPVDLRLQDHLEYQLARCAARELSRRRTVGAVLRSPVMPRASKPREALRVIANRGSARRPRAHAA